MPSRETDADFVLKAKQRAVARAEKLRETPQAKQAVRRGKALIRKLKSEKAAQAKQRA